MDPQTIFETLLYLPYADIASSCQVNKIFRKVSNDPYFWHLKLNLEYPSLAKIKGVNPKKIFQYLNGPAKLKAKLVDVPKHIFLYTEDYFQAICEGDRDTLVARKINESEYTLDYLRKQNIKRGDIIHLDTFSTYRNDGKFIYNGKQIETLNLCIDDYGSVPSDYKVIDEFSIHYWNDNLINEDLRVKDYNKYVSNAFNIIKHNTIVHFDIKPYIDQVLTNGKYNQSDTKIGNVIFITYIYRSYFIHKSEVPFFVQIESSDIINIGSIKDNLSNGLFCYDSYDSPKVHYSPDYIPELTIFMRLRDNKVGF